MFKKLFNLFSNNDITLKCIECGYEIKLPNSTKKSFIPPLCPKCSAKMESNNQNISY